MILPTIHEGLPYQEVVIDMPVLEERKKTCPLLTFFFGGAVMTMAVVGIISFLLCFFSGKYIEAVAVVGCMWIAMKIVFILWE